MSSLCVAFCEQKKNNYTNECFTIKKGGPVTFPGCLIPLEKNLFVTILTRLSKKVKLIAKTNALLKKEILILY